jgi:hypothetical protein
MQNLYDAEGLMVGRGNPRLVLSEVAAGDFGHWGAVKILAQGNLPGNNEEARFAARLHWERIAGRAMSPNVLQISLDNMQEVMGLLWSGGIRPRQVIDQVHAAAAPLVDRGPSPLESSLRGMEAMEEQIDWLQQQLTEAWGVLGKVLLKK